MQPQATDTYGMTQIDSGNTQERLEKIENNQKRNDQNDTLYIKNIDVDCNDETFDPVRVSERFRDPETGRVVTQFRDITYHFKHSEGFQVRWAGQPFTIKPGQTMKMPRFLGEHFASQLADHILGKKGDAMNKMLRTDPIERPRVLKEIILKEESYFAPMESSVGEAALEQVENMNKPSIEGIEGEQFNDQGGKGIELREGDATPTNNIQTTVGTISKESVESTGDVIARLGKEDQNDTLNVPEEWKQYSKADLIQQIRHMAPDYKFGSNVTKAQLVSILKTF